MSKNIFVLGTDDFNLVKLKSLRKAAEYNIYKLLDFAEIRGKEEYPVDELLVKAKNRLQAFDGPVDGIIGYYDFPVTDMIPILCKEYNIPSASLEAVLKCEHKYWSRVEQKKCIPEHVPDFAVFDPFDEQALEKVHLDFPFWIKPVKSFRSFLGFMIRSEEDFYKSVQLIRQKIRRISEPFDHLLNYINMPADIDNFGGVYCLAEAIISGRQCTIEGYGFDGGIYTYGIVDSIRDANRSTFARYEYPSKLPKVVQERIEQVSKTVMQHLNFYNSCFNIEFFYNENEDKLWLLEINPRISQSHADLFQKVDGASNHEIMVDLALGNRPEPPYRQGEFNHAAKFMLRAFEDGFVKKVPDVHEIQALSHMIPGTFVEILVKEGMKLSDLINQDSYSFELADIYVGGSTQTGLLENYQKVIDNLDLQIEPIQERKEVIS